MNRHRAICVIPSRTCAKPLATKTAAPPFLRTTRRTIQLNPDALDAGTLVVDVHQFQTLYQQAVNDRVAAKAAIALYHASFLNNPLVTDSPEFDTWAQLQREMLHRQMAELLHCVVTPSPETVALYATIRDVRHAFGAVEVVDASTVLKKTVYPKEVESRTENERDQPYHDTINNSTNNIDVDNADMDNGGRLPYTICKRQPLKVRASTMSLCVDAVMKGWLGFGISSGITNKRDRSSDRQLR